MKRHQIKSKKGSSQAVTKEKRKTGRPATEIDWEKFDYMCFLQCTLTEIAALHGVTIDTIHARVKATWGMSFSEYYEMHAARSQRAIRQAQLKAALNGNSALLIWLGKQKLGQKEKQEITGVDGAPIKTELVVERKMTLEEVEELARQTLAAAERARQRAALKATESHQDQSGKVVESHLLPATTEKT